jgi:hypothetical protein
MTTHSASFRTSKTPIHPALLFTGSGSNQLGTRTGVPAIHITTQSLLAAVARDTQNNPQAITLIQSAMTTIQKIQKDFSGEMLTIVKATPGPSRLFAQLNNAIKHRPAKVQSQMQLDVMSLQAVDQGLRGFGIELSSVPLA